MTCVGGSQQSTGFSIHVQSQLSFDVDYVSEYSDVSSIPSLALWQRTRPSLEAALKSQIPGVIDVSLISLTNQLTLIINYIFTIETSKIMEQFLNRSRCHY